MTETQALMTIIRHYGEHHQVCKATEELSEATTACARYSRTYSREHFEDLAEELADALIMIDQLKIIIPNLSERIVQYRRLKIDRQLHRVEVDE